MEKELQLQLQLERCRSAGSKGELKLQSKLEILRDTNKSRGEPLERRYLEAAATTTPKNQARPSPKSPSMIANAPKYFSTELAGGCLRPATLPACHLAALPRCVVIECQQAQHGQSSLLCLCLFARLGAHLWVVVSAKNGTRRETNPPCLPSCLYSWLHKVRQCRRQLLIYG